MDLDANENDFDIIAEYRRIKSEFGDILKERLEAFGWTIDEATRYKQDLAKKTENERDYDSTSMSFSRDLFKVERDLRAANNPEPNF